MTSRDPNVHPRRRAWGSPLSLRCRQIEQEQQSSLSPDTGRPSGLPRPPPDAVPAGTALLVSPPSRPPVGNPYFRFSLLNPHVSALRNLLSALAGTFPQTTLAGSSVSPGFQPAEYHGPRNPHGVSVTSTGQYFINLKMLRVGFLSCNLNRVCGFPLPTLQSHGFCQLLIREVDTVKHLICKGFHFVLLPNPIQEGTFLTLKKHNVL